MMSKVSIAGFGVSRDEMPTKGELWGMNSLWKALDRRWTRWFEMHDGTTLGSFYKEVAKFPAVQASLSEQHQFLASLSIPIYFHEPIDDFSTSVAYPIDTVGETLGEPYFCSTVAYMMALAIHEGYKEIGLYGIDLAAESEWAYQRPNMEYVIGLARGRGIKVTIAQPSSLLAHPGVYGRDVNLTAFAEMLEAARDRSEELTNAANSIETSLKTLIAAINTMSGRIQLIDWMLNEDEFIPTPAQSSILQDELVKLQESKVKLTVKLKEGDKELREHHGAIKEDYYFIQAFTHGHRAAHMYKTNKLGDSVSKN